MILLRSVRVPRTTGIPGVLPRGKSRAACDHRRGARTFGAMSVRTLSGALLAIYIAVLCAPFVITLGFVLDRDRIARDLCVQRAVPKGERTCHGQCHLMKRLLVEKGGRTAPAAPLLLPEKIQPEFSEAVLELPKVTRTAQERPPVIEERTLLGFAERSDHVPWC